MRAGWTLHRGRAVVLPMDNVDTDQLIPARFMSVPRAEGYGGFLLHDLRRDNSERLLADFPLNRHDDTSILIAGRNFGSGSSREAAVYALVDAGIRAVIAPSFGDIFANNAINNGLLPAQVSEYGVNALMSVIGDDAVVLSVDLNTKSVKLGAQEVTFALDDSWRTKLINGWDDIDLTQQHRAQIEQFRDTRRQTAPWAWPTTVG